MDAVLIALAQAANAGNQCPILKVIAGTMSTSEGRRPRRRFSSRSKTQPLPVLRRHSRRSERDRQPLGFRQPRRDLVDPGDPFALAKSFVDPLEETFAEPGEPTAITLAPVEVRGPDGSGLRLSAVRVPIEAVESWWIGEGKELKGSGSSGSWFAGVVFPLP